MDSAQAAELGRQRKRSKEERRGIVEETLQPGMSVARVSLAHGVNANQVFYWRKLYREGRLSDEPPNSGLLPVKIAGTTARLEAIRRGGPTRTGVIDIEVGTARIRIEGTADPDCVRAALEGLVR
jgi:transposase